MSIWNKVDNAKPTTWLVDGMTQEEVRECIDNGKIKCAVLKALEDVRAEIEALYDGDVCAKEHNCDTDVLDIIDRKIKEIKHES